MQCTFGANYSPKVKTILLSYYEREDSSKSVVIGQCIVNLHWCKKNTHDKSMVKNIIKGDGYTSILSIVKF